MAMMGSGYERRPEPEAPAGPRLRVYELAKDLNVQPKDLLNKVRAMGIDVANHMSHLESVDVDRVRRAVERERLENLEEVRLNDTVIRRRSKSAVAGSRGARRRPLRRRTAAAAPAPAPRAPAASRRRPARRRRGVPAPRRRAREPEVVEHPAPQPRPAPPSAAPAPAAAAAPPQPAAPPAGRRGQRRRSVGERRNDGRSRRPPRRAPRRPSPALRTIAAAGRHRIGGDGRVHPASRHAGRAATPGAALRDQGSRRGAEAARAAPRR